MFAKYALCCYMVSMLLTCLVSPTLSPTSFNQQTESYQLEQNISHSKLYLHPSPYYSHMLHHLALLPLVLHPLEQSFD